MSALSPSRAAFHTGRYPLHHTVNDWLRTLLNEASFVYTRETKTHDVLAKAGVTKPVIGFMPDGTFDFSAAPAAISAGISRAGPF